MTKGTIPTVGERDANVGKNRELSKKRGFRAPKTAWPGGV
jgi:hypothetical protein